VLWLVAGKMQEMISEFCAFMLFHFHSRWCIMDLLFLIWFAFGCGCLDTYVIMQ